MWGRIARNTRRNEKGERLWRWIKYKRMLENAWVNLPCNYCVDYSTVCWRQRRCHRNAECVPVHGYQINRKKTWSVKTLLEIVLKKRVINISDFYPYISRETYDHFRREEVRRMAMSKRIEREVPEKRASELGVYRKCKTSVRSVAGENGNVIVNLGLCRGSALYFHVRPICCLVNI